jgi:hypothetical protein
VEHVEDKDRSMMARWWWCQKACWRLLMK